MRITELKVLQGIPFSKEDNRWLTFDSLSQQKNFFEDYSIANFTQLSFVRGFAYKKIRLDIDYDKILYANYIMFRNEEYSNKWLYAYIQNFTYIADGCTEIDIEMDYFQSYISEIKFMPCYLERAMAIDNDDLISVSNLQEETDLNIDTTLKKCISQVYHHITDWSVAIQYKPNLVLESITGEGVFSALNFDSSDDYLYKDLQRDSNYNTGLLLPNKYWSGCAIQTYQIRNIEDAQNITSKAWQLELLGYTIQRMYMIPTSLRNTFNYDTNIDLPTFPYYSQDKAVKRLYTEDFIPLNNKTYTFIYYEVLNGNGKSKKYNPVSLGNNINNFKFHITYECLNGIHGITYPLYYETASASPQTQWNYGIELGDVPDTNWNTQTADVLKGLIGSVAGLVTGGIGGGIVGSALQAGKQLFKSADGGISTDSVLNLINDTIGWTYKMFAPIHLDDIDKYFSLYGYQLNFVFEPIIHNRTRWNYVRTRNANIQGDIPIQAKKEIETALNNGITFWHDKNNFDYFDNNGKLTNGITSTGSGLTEDYTLF